MRPKGLSTLNFETTDFIGSVGCMLNRCLIWQHKNFGLDENSWRIHLEDLCCISSNANPEQVSSSCGQSYLVCRRSRSSSDPTLSLALAPGYLGSGRTMAVGSLVKFEKKGTFGCLRKLPSREGSLIWICFMQREGRICVCDRMRRIISSLIHGQKAALYL